MNLSPIVQGCMKWGVWGANFSLNEFQQAIETCLSAGITSFDHADIYGGYTTEASFGKAWKAMDVSREKVQLISKCGIQIEHLRPKNFVKHYQYDAAYIIESALKSIADLNCSYLDLFLLHRPSPLLQGEEVAKAIDFLKSEGLIKHFGVSNFSVHELAYLQSFVSVEYNQLQLSLLTSEPLTNGLIDYMKLHKIQAMCWNPLGNYYQHTNTTLNEVITNLASKYQTDINGILLSWLMQIPHPIFPVIGTTNLQRMIDATDAINCKFQPQDWFLLWETARGQQVP